jgi:hypothetical protein
MGSLGPSYYPYTFGTSVHLNYIGSIEEANRE